MATFTPKRIKIIKTFNLYCCFFVLGLCVAVPGPTLIDLQNLVNTDIKTIAFIYTARSCGYLIGSLTGGVFFDMMARKQCILTIFNLLISVTMFAIPWSRQIRTLTIWMVLNGLSLGVIDTGGNVCCLNLWGKDSGPFFQALHFTYGVGGLVAPLVAAPFLGDYSTQDTLYNSSVNYINQTDFQPYTNQTGLQLSKEEFENSSSITGLQIPSVAYAYISIGGFSFLVTILFFVMCIVSPIDQCAQKTQASESNKISFCITSFLVFLVCLLILTSMGTEIGYAQMLTTYAAKGPLKLTTTTGSYMTSAYWAAFTASRLAAIFLTIKFSNLTLLMFDIALTCLGSLTLLFLAISYEWALWLASVILGIGIASFFPASVSWVEQYITVTNKIASMFTVGAAFGEMLIPYTISSYIDDKPEVFIYVVVVSCAVSVIVTLIMYLVLRKLPDKYKVREGVVNAAYNAENSL